MHIICIYIYIERERERERDFKGLQTKKTIDLVLMYLAVVFIQMNKTLNLQNHGIFCIIWSHIKVFTKCFHGKSVCPVISGATGEKKPAGFLDIVIFYEAFRGNL